MREIKATALKMCLVLEYLAFYWEYFHQKYGCIIIKNARGHIYDGKLLSQWKINRAGEIERNTNYQERLYRLRDRKSVV